MTKEKRSLFVRFLIGFVILVGLDQWTKGLASAYLKGNSPLVLIRGVKQRSCFWYAPGEAAVLFPDRCFSSCRSSLHVMAYA